MKKFGLFLAPFVLVLVLCTGCDYIRASLGKPTSADLNKISDEVKAQEQRLRDSVAAVRAEQARLEAGEPAAAVPPTATADTPAAQPAAQPAAAPAKAVDATSDLKKYYAVAGAFKNPEGAQKYVSKLQENGFQVRLFDFRSGLKVVCTGGSDSIEDARADVEALRKLHLSDSDPWIYNTNQKLHR